MFGLLRTWFQPGLVRAGCGQDIEGVEFRLVNTVFYWKLCRFQSVLYLNYACMSDFILFAPVFQF